MSYFQQSCELGLRRGTPSKNFYTNKTTWNEAIACIFFLSNQSGEVFRSVALRDMLTIGLEE